MVKRGNKKGSHVGVMISFVIFITFIIFMYSIVQPALNVQRDKESLSASLEAGILKKISYDVTTGTVFLEDSLGTGCVKLNNINDELNIGRNIAVSGDSGEVLSSYTSSSGLEDILVQGTGTPERILKIHYSPILDPAEIVSLICTELNEGEDYTIGVVKTQKYLFEIKMIELIGEYSTKYEDLKTELNILEGMDFGYGIILSNGTTIETNGEDPSTNIYIQQTPIQYISLNGDILTGYIKTKIW
jgi:hypothetical protein